MDRLKERLREQYAPLVERFVKEVGELDLKAWKRMAGRI